MKEIKIIGRAKINISLDVLGKRRDGYHEVKMIMQQVDLYDEISIAETKGGIHLRSDCEFIPLDEGNIAYKAARMMMDHYKINKGVRIYIKKNIPVAAGLAGGSTDAAAVIMGMNKLFHIGASREELMEIGLGLGADVPFCILGGAALAEGIGEKLTPIHGLKNVWVVLCKPNISVSTADVYNQLDMEKIQKHPETDKILEALNERSLPRVTENLCNVLECVTENMYPIVGNIKRKMLQYHAMGALMSGSGPTVFGIYKDYSKAKSAWDNLSRIYKQTYVVKTYIGGRFE